VDLPEAASHDAEALARHVFAQPAKWFAVLLRFRDALVRPLGLKRAVDLRAMGGDRINLFGYSSGTMARSFSVKTTRISIFVCRCWCSRHLKANRTD
jgi:hypothetical protein